MIHLGFVSVDTPDTLEIRRQAYEALLAQPDPPDLLGRGHHEPIEGMRDKQDALISELPQRFIQHYMMEHRDDGALFLSSPYPS